MYSERAISENVVRWTRAKKEGLGKGLVPFPVIGSVWKTGANNAKYAQSMHLVGEIRIHVVHDRGVHGNGNENHTGM